MRVLLHPLDVEPDDAVRDGESRRRIIAGLVRALEKGDRHTKGIAQTAVCLVLWEQLITAFEAERGPLPKFIQNVQSSVRSFEEMLG